MVLTPYILGALGSRGGNRAAILAFKEIDDLLKSWSDLAGQAEKLLNLLISRDAVRESMTIDAAFSQLATLTTARLRIRPIRAADAETVFAFKSNADSTRRFGQDPHLSVQQTKVWIERNLADYERRGSMTWALTFKEDDAAIGECCLWNFDAAFHCAEIGYELHPEHWGKGLMKEALQEIIAYGFNAMELHRIEAEPLAGNERSKTLLLRLGFQLEGVLRERVFFDNRCVDQLCFGLLREDWASRNMQQQ